MSNNNNNTTTTIPVGLDVSTLYCRVAIQGRGVVSNTQGARFTLGLVAREEATAEGDGAAFVFGDAAQRSTHLTLAQAVEQDAEAAQAFFQYVIQLAADNAAVSVDALRLVVTLPPSTTNPQAWLDCMTSACKSLIPDKKKRKQTFVLGVVEKSAATCLAHSIAEDTKKMLVVDMDGDAALQWTVLESAGGVYSTRSDGTVPDVSGPVVVQLLASFCATQFERQAKIPRGEVMERKKCRTKLIKEAERQLLSGKTSMSFMLDGLYDGMDCNVTVSKPRWDMMTGKLLRQVEAALQPLVGAEYSVLLSGAWATSLLKPTLVKLFGNAIIASGSSVTPEEAVVLGCAKQAGCLAAIPLLHTASTTVSVPVSPVSLGFCLDGAPLIPLGTPLPVQTTYTSTTGSSCKLYQLAPTQRELADFSDLEDEAMLAIELSAEGTLLICDRLGETLVTI